MCRLLFNAVKRPKKAACTSQKNASTEFCTKQKHDAGCAQAFCGLVQQQGGIQTVGQIAAMKCRDKIRFSDNTKISGTYNVPIHERFKNHKGIKMKHLTKLLAAALLALGLNQAVWADDASDFRQTLQLAEQGVAEAQNNLGLMYYNGQYVRQNYAEAFRWFRQAADQGNAEAQYNLGVMYDNGQDVRQDYTEALRWYRKAAEQGYALAENNLGVMYNNGDGVRQDYAEALKWYRQAAEQGYAAAQYNLGAMYFTGRGAHQDFHLSKEWFGKACDGGVQEGCIPYRYLNQKGY